MSKVRVCFLGTTDFAVRCLETLLKDDHFEVVGVVTQPDRPAGRKLQLTPSPVKALAVQRNLTVLAPESLKGNKMMVDEILSWQAEVAVVVAFGQILTQEFIDSFNFGCVNVHASLLPRWRGAAPIQRAIEIGDKESGVCLQKVVKKLDAGDVLGARRIAITEEMNSLELHDQLAPLAGDLLQVELMDYVRGNLAGLPQNEADVTYAKKIEKSESLLDWSKPALELHNKVRAFVWGPGTYATTAAGKRLKIHKTKVHSEASVQQAPGTVISSSGSLIVACGQGSIELLEVQPESRNKMSAADFLKSAPIEVGSAL